MTRLRVVYEGDEAGVGRVLLTETYADDGSLFAVCDGVQMGVVRKVNGVYVSDRCDGSFKVPLAAAAATVRKVKADIVAMHDRRGAL